MKSNIIPMSRYRKPRAIRKINEQEMIAAKVFVELMQSAGFTRKEALDALKKLYDKENNNA